MDGSPPLTVDLESLGLDRGGHILVQSSLAALEPGQAIRVIGTDPHLRLHLSGWCRAEGHDFDGNVVRKGRATDDRWNGAVRAGRVAEPAAAADPAWGLAPRGALVELGGPSLHTVDLIDRDAVWTEIAPKLYAQALAGQWDPAVAVDWTMYRPLPAEVEDAVVQVMTYLIENEQAALTVPAQHLGRIHPQFREVAAFLATQVADEARHIEVFTRRAISARQVLGTSTVGGRASLQTLLDEADFGVAVFLLSVLGEGTFLDLLSFLERHAPDPVTRRIAHLVRADEARHVAFGQALLEQRVLVESTQRDALRTAIERRHDTLRASAGLNPSVRDALIVLAGGDLNRAAIAAGWQRVVELERDMHEGRRRRLVRLGFDESAADELAALHTRNFM